MRKNLLCLAFCFGATLSAFSQTILNEGFETSSTTSVDPNIAEGWTTIDSYTGNKDKYRWYNYYLEKGTITGKHVAACDGPLGTYSEDYANAKGPREEILLSPELTLDNTYQLSFDWKAANASALTNKEYDFQIRIVEENGDAKTAPAIWSFQNADQLKDSGVLNFPWGGWTTYNSKIDLSSYVGKKVKIAFVYKMLKNISNVLYIDNVNVSQFTPPTAPKPTLSKKIYGFGDAIIGSKKYSEVITLKNEGLNGLKITEIVYPTGVSSTINAEAVNLDKNSTLNFQISYTSALTSTTDGEVIIKTNGGDVSIRVTANKVALAEGYTFEGFEDKVPPIGWSGEGWSGAKYAFEGDQSAYCAGTISKNSELISPRLDLSTGNHTLSYTYFNQVDEEGDYYQDNDIIVKFSTDGGETWEEKFVTPYDADLNVLKDIVVDLGAPQSDNCYVKWVYTPLQYDSEVDYVYSVYYLDNVQLPPMYGADGLAPAATLNTPANEVKDLYNKNVTLTWNKSLFASGYKLYLGTDAEATNVLNGVDVKNTDSYTINRCEYATTYYWKVVAYNAKGDSETSETWSFSTMADQTISTFPWNEGFESGQVPPLGWNLISDSGTKWKSNRYAAFDGNYSMSIGCYKTETGSTIETPEVVLPANPMQISFYWGNAIPVSLSIDKTGLVKNTSTEDNGIDAGFFDIFVDGEWKQLRIISDSNNKYWCKEEIDLTEYANKTVSFRWRYIGHSYVKSPGVAVDCITIAEATDFLASFNEEGWNAGKVNYMESVNSGSKFTLLNEGSKAFTIKKVSFATSNFSTDLVAGKTIAPKDGVVFSVGFDASTTNAEVVDKMTVEFEEGNSLTFDVKGVALASDVKYFSFENDTPGNTNPIGFTTIDVDHKSTMNIVGMNYPSYGLPFAYCVQDNSDWNNVFNPVSGSKVLVAMSPFDYSSTDDWLISGVMTATNESVFNFYARLWNSINSILPENQSTVEVLVSTTSNTDRSTFQTVMYEQKIPYYNTKNYEYYSVDLSAYAGQDIYVALRHRVTDGLAAFFDDLSFEHFASFAGVNSTIQNSALGVYPNPVSSTAFITGAEKANVKVFNTSSSLVLKAEGVNSIDMSDLAPGLYLVAIESEAGSKTVRVMKK